MHATRRLGKAWSNRVRKGMRNVQKEESGGAAYGTFGYRSARGMDEMPGLGKQSTESKVANLIANDSYKGKKMDEVRGWGTGKGMTDLGVKEDFEGTDFWRVQVGPELVDKAGEEGLEQWIEGKKEEIDLAAPYKPIPSTQEREDLPPYMHWMVPPKRVRLELKLKEDARKFRKTPEFDMSVPQQRVTQQIYDGLENASAAFPIPIKGSRENFCVTHVECVQWKSKEQWIVCWKLVLNEAERPQYEMLLDSTASKLVYKWGRMIRDYYAPCRSLVPLLQFLYDDGSIPYRDSYIEQNMKRSSRGEAPIPLYGRNPDVFSMQPPRAPPSKTPDHDPVKSFLLEARRELS